MKRSIVAIALLAATVVAGCSRTSSASGGAAHHGRYVGIGIYSPGEPWTRMTAANAATATGGAARPADDQAVIVVVDSDTGEIRGCGDLTGYCIGMNPWKTALAASQLAPINLTERARAAAAP